MRTYYPMAITDKGTKSIYVGTDTISEALQQFETWEKYYSFRIREAWIDEYESGQKIKKLSVAKKWVLESEDA